MSKSIGNIIAPKEVIDRFGAEILRLWVSATDYRDDIRISEKILQQLSDSYRRIRNTCRFMLGNLSDFDPEKDAVSYASMMEIDRYMLHTLQVLIEKARKAYDEYELHLIYHSLYNYCTVELSAFYLDILKDRLYTSPRSSLKRRSAQTALYKILDGIVKLMAPVLPFTSEEVWFYTPDRKGKEKSVHLAGLPEVRQEYRDNELSDRWEKILDVRREVSKALELARAEKRIGHSLDAAITVSVDGSLYDALVPVREELRHIFIVSQATLERDKTFQNAFTSEDIDGLAVQVRTAEGEKCARCWVHDPSVGSDSEQETICSRCRNALEELSNG